ncbi:MAG: serine/threonine-protein kinase [Candidatus Melainabacteria bacterium]|nr:serine/threonine-protein kinase [Candidatus Melainabacteria bacterium]
MKEGDIIDGRYRVQNLLGQGGMGQVFRGHDLELDKTVAIKVLFPNTPDQVIKRFHTEAKALAKFNHPNIMKVEHFGQASNGQLYLINEFVKGDSLSQMIETRGSQTFPDILPIFEKICRGLRYAHMQQVLHRDIKPSNVMLAVDRSKEGGVKLVDFGLAKPNDQSHELTKTGAAMGSPPYMSPESVHGKETDVRSDIYSLGCTLFEMMAGIPPFVGETAFHTMMAQISRLPPTLQQACDKPFDEEVENYVQKFIKKNPADRYQDMDEVIAELDRVKSALYQKRGESEALMVSGLYASGAWIAKKAKNMNRALKVTLTIGVVALVVSLPFVWMRYINISAPKTISESDTLRALPDSSSTPKLDATMDSTFEGVAEYKPGATVIKDKDSEYKCCVLSGDLDRQTLRQTMNDGYKTYKCFQFQKLNLDVHSMRYVLGFPIQKLVLTSTTVNDELLKAVGKMNNLVHLRITKCGSLPPAGLENLRPLKSLLTVDIEGGKDYKHPITPFAKMPVLTWLTFRNCTIDREDLKAAATLPMISMLKFEDCIIAPDAIPELKAARTCSALAINRATLTPQQFKQIGELPFIAQLNLNNTNIDDSTLSSFAGLKKLSLVELKNTTVTRAGVSELVTANPGLQAANVAFGNKTYE